MARFSVGGEQSTMVKTRVDEMVTVTTEGPRLKPTTTQEMLELAAEAPGQVFIVALDRYQVLDIERRLEDLTRDRLRFTVLRLSQHRDLRGKSGRVFIDQAVLDAGRESRRAEVEALLRTSSGVEISSRQISAGYTLDPDRALPVLLVGFAVLLAVLGFVAALVLGLGL